MHMEHTFMLFFVQICTYVHHISITTRKIVNMHMEHTFMLFFVQICTYVCSHGLCTHLHIQNLWISAVFYFLRFYQGVIASYHAPTKKHKVCFLSHNCHASKKVWDLIITSSFRSYMMMEIRRIWSWIVNVGSW